MEIMNTLQETLRIWRTQKVILLYSFVPLIIGVTLYGYLGHLLFGSLLVDIKAMLLPTVGQGWGEFLYYILAFLLSIVLFFFINWTFVSIVSLLTAPFCDSISARTEVAMGVKNQFKSIGMVASFWNEFKKILVLLLVAIVAFALSFFPILIPISLMLTALATAFSLLDYTYIRHGLRLHEIFGDFRKSFIQYLIIGALFMFVMSIPIVNLISLPIGVIFCTIFYNKKKAVNG